MTEPQLTGATRLLCLSDPHGEFDHFPAETLPDADIVLIAGDFTNYGDRHGQREIGRARAWMSEMLDRYPLLLYVCGNHDFGCNNVTFADRVLNDSPGKSAGNRSHGIEREMFSASGLKFLGASLSPCFDVPQLASAWCRMTADRTIDAAEWDGKPYADVVISHSPPEGILDHAGRMMRQQPTGKFDWVDRHVGSPGLLRYINTVAPRLVICGHIHEAAGIEEYSATGTTVINCARTAVLVTISPDSLHAIPVG